MDEYGEEEDDEEKAQESDRKKQQEKPVVPVFNREEFLKKWLEENPPIEVPSEEEPERDADWILSDDEEQSLVNSFLKGKSDES